MEADSIRKLAFQFKSNPRPIWARLRLIEAHDERGRQAMFNRDPQSGFAGRFKNCIVAVAGDARTLDLQVAVQRSRFVDFLVEAQLHYTKGYFIRR